MTSRRLESVRKNLSESRLHAFLVTHLPHVQYLTGFSGSNGACLITRNRQWFLTDVRYRDQAPQEVGGFDIIISVNGFAASLAKRKLLSPGSTVGFEGSHLSVAQLDQFKKLFPRVRFVSRRSIIESLVSVKEDYEIPLIRNAVAITEKVFARILETLRPGMKELDVAAEIVYLHRRLGADGDAFEPIVASGARASLPHARASEKKIQKGEMVILDFGCRYRGYHSDLTRTISVGKPSPEMKRIYGVVLDAQRRALDSTRNGIRARNLDRVARTVITKRGYGRYFNHSLGHGLGREVHETPRISALSTDILRTSNVVTIEPGIYLPGTGGVRIEDDVIVRENDCEILTGSPKQLVIV